MSQTVKISKTLASPVPAKELPLVWIYQKKGASCDTCPLRDRELTCETVINSCGGNSYQHGGPCQHRVTCHNDPEHLVCMCSAANAGKFFNTDHNECLPALTTIGLCYRIKVMATLAINSYPCQGWVPGHQGRHCDLEVNECVLLIPAWMRLYEWDRKRYISVFKSVLVWTVSWKLMNVDSSHVYTVPCVRMLLRLLWLYTEILWRPLWTQY